MEILALYDPLSRKTLYIIGRGRGEVCIIYLYVIPSQACAINVQW